MRSLLSFGIAGVGVASLCLCAQTPDAQAPARQAPGLQKAGPVNETQGMPPRAAPSDYPVQAKAGVVTIAAEFAGHAIPTPGGPLSTEDYVVVEAAFYGPPEARLQLSFSDFALRINGRKTPVQSQPYERVAQSAKDPEWEPPEKPEKSKTSIGGGGGGSSDATKEPVKVPFEVRRAMTQRIKKASLAEGDRPLPQAGLLYFPYGGKEKGVRSIELIYSGPAGDATLELQP